MKKLIESYIRENFSYDDISDPLEIVSYYQADQDDVLDSRAPFVGCWRIYDDQYQEYVIIENGAVKKISSNFM
jgi:hypothetical protein